MGIKIVLIWFVGDVLKIMCCGLNEKLCSVIYNVYLCFLINELFYDNFLKWFVDVKVRKF